MKLSLPTEHFRMCDASAGVALPSGLFVVGNDEDNRLRTYLAAASGQPISEEPDLSCELVTGGDECDIEGCATVGDPAEGGVTYWITSHGRDKHGVERKERCRFFATRFTEASGAWQVAIVGAPWHSLLEEMVRWG